MGRDFADRPIIINSKVTPPKSKPSGVKVQSESDFDNYDKVRDESPMHIIGYQPEWDMDSKEKELRRIR
uniref:Uncharacterized protein n=1 Tax=viral metagenome TaxID=1070528 RepID=A0A6M3JHC2_9ZZZZ